MNIPEPGFYQHFKHDPAGPAWNYLYELTSVVQDTEDDSLLVIYRPLYNETRHNISPSGAYARPLDMFVGEVSRGGKTFPRFTRISDPLLIEKLKGVRDMKYEKRN